MDERRRPKAVLSAVASELMLSRPDDMAVNNRMQHIDVDWTNLESSLDSCDKLLTCMQTLLLPSMQAASELNTWMDGVEHAVKLDCDIRPKAAVDVQQLHTNYKVRLSWQKPVFCRN